MRTIYDGIAAIKPADRASRELARKKILSLTMPPWALGRLCDLGVELSGMTRSVPPKVGRKMIVAMAGDHGVAAEGVSAFPPEVTWQMVANIIAGGAGVNVLSRLNGVRVEMADLGMAWRDEELVKAGKLLDYNVGKGTADLAKGPAMSRDQAARAVEAGIAIAERFKDEVDVFGTGEMGIANTTPATAICAVLAGKPVASICGRGTGIDDARLAHKVKIIETGLAVNNPDASDGLDVLAKVGGFEIGGIAGLIVGAAALGKPVVVDGFISTSGLMIAKALCPAVMDYVLLAHASAEPGHAAMCGWLGKEPLVHLDLRLGEGTGAALAMNFVEAAARIMSEMATFDSAGVAGGEQNK